MSIHGVLHRLPKRLSAATRHAVIARSAATTIAGSCRANSSSSSSSASVSGYEQFRTLAVTEPATAVMQARINRRVLAYTGPCSTGSSTGTDLLRHWALLLLGVAQNRGCDDLLSLSLMACCAVSRDVGLVVG